MIETLGNMLGEILELTKKPEAWDSLIINRRKPYTERLFTHIDNYRVCLHKFTKCTEFDTFPHPHPWPAAFLVLHGAYTQTLSYAPSLKSDLRYVVSKQLMRPGSFYDIVSRYTWHSIVPHMDTYTVMINGEPWEEPHICVRTTKGKDLDSLSDSSKNINLAIFEMLLKNYLDEQI